MSKFVNCLHIVVQFCLVFQFYLIDYCSVSHDLEIFNCLVQ